MSYLDIAIIVVLSLGALIGMKKGLFKSLLGLFGWLLSAIIAFCITKVVAYALLDVQSIQGFVIGSEGSLYTWVSSWMPSIDAVPSFLQGIIAPLIEEALATAVSGTVSADTVLALFVTYYMFCAIVFVALLILIRIATSLVLMILKSFDKGEKPSGMSRLLGFLVGAVHGMFYVIIVLFVLTYLVAIPQLNFLGEAIQTSMIGKPICDYIQVYAGKLFSSDNSDTLTKLMMLAGISG